MGSGPEFAKLRKAIRKGTVEDIVRAMFHLRFRVHKAKTHGENITSETNSELRHLKIGGAPAKVVAALALCKEKAGPIWDKVREDQPAESPAPTPNSTSQPNEASS